MDKSRRLIMKLPETLIQNSENAYSLLPHTLLLLDEVSNRWTEKQAEAIGSALLGDKQKTIAVKLSLVQSTVNKRLNGAGWNKLSQFLGNMEYRLSRR